MFPQLIAGPIVRYADIEPQIANRQYSLNKTALGIRRFVLGLGKKVLIANSLGELCNIFQSSNDKSVLFYWLYAVSFTLQIYFDFSGYSDMAIGLGKILGFDFKENFNYPYISRSITEFWRRWHISLGTWFRDYVYISLGGNRVSKIRQFANILIVWALTGLWHGDSWNFVIWGLYFAIVLILEKLFIRKFIEKSRVISHVYVMFLVIISFVIFNADNLEAGVSYISAMFGAGNLPLTSLEFNYYFRSYAIILIMAIIGSTPLPKMIVEKIGKIGKTAKYKNGASWVLAIAEPVILTCLLLLVTAYIVDGSFNPFLYFRF
jgi:alginate O-acetyltransferase complex protein AlgI